MVKTSMNSLKKGNPKVLYLYVVCDMGNPWVVFTLSVPIPVKTRTHVHGYGFSRVSSWVRVWVHYPRIRVCIYDS